MAFTYEQIFTDNITFSNPAGNVQLIADDVVESVIAQITSFENSYNADVSTGKASITTLLSHRTYLQTYVDDIVYYMIHTDAITGVTDGNANGGPTFNDYLRASAAIQTANELPSGLGAAYSKVEALKVFDVMDLFESISETFTNKVDTAHTTCVTVFNSSAYTTAKNQWSNTDQTKVNAYTAEVAKIVSAISTMLSGVTLAQLVDDEVALYNQTEEAQVQLGKAGIMYAGQQDPALAAITNRLTGQ